MSLFARRPRLPLLQLQPIITRGLGRAVGNAVNVWLNGPGKEYMEPTDGPNWLGKNRPFPMNDTFKPPPPISDKAKDEIYRRYISNPKKFTIRVLSGAYGISLKRVDAILRLKGMEESWKKEKTLQTGFVAGMESMLKPTKIAIGVVPESRMNVAAADLQDQDETDDRARDRYQRLFWEPLADGEEPIVPQTLEKAKEEARVARKTANNAKSDVKLLTGSSDSKTVVRREKTIVVSAGPGRPATMFKDVGGSFLDIEDRTRRINEGDRRKQARAKSKRSVDS